MAPPRAGERDDPQQAQEGGGGEGFGNKVSHSFHHDGKNCLATQVPPNKSSGEAELGHMRERAKVPSGWNSARLGDGGRLNLGLLSDLKKAQKRMCPGMTWPTRAAKDFGEQYLMPSPKFFHCPQAWTAVTCKEGLKEKPSSW